MNNIYSFEIFARRAPEVKRGDSEKPQEREKTYVRVMNSISQVISFLIIPKFRTRIIFESRSAR